MNEQAAVDALKNLIKTNDGLLVQGLFAQGSQINIHMVSATILSPPIASYHVAINIPSVINQTRTAEGQMANPPRSAVYQTQVWLAGNGVIEPEYEDNPYELAHRNFRLFGDRVAYLIESQSGWVNDPITGIAFQLTRQTGQDRAITKQNEITPNETNNIVGLLTILSFRLTQNCNQSDGLYASIPG